MLVTQSLLCIRHPPSGELAPSRVAGSPDMAIYANGDPTIMRRDNADLMRNVGIGLQSLYERQKQESAASQFFVPIRSIFHHGG